MRLPSLSQYQSFLLRGIDKEGRSECGDLKKSFKVSIKCLSLILEEGKIGTELGTIMVYKSISDINIKDRNSCSFFNE